MNGSILDSVGTLANLNFLAFYNNYWKGSIPMNISKMMPSLEVLDLSGNFLNGSIPLSIGELSFALQKCKGLTMLDLGENRFYENIPKYIGQSFSSLWELRIRDNMFSGNIPEQLCSLAHLQILDLALNNLSGSIPSCLGKLGALNSMISYSPHQFSLSDPIYQQMEMELVVKGRQLIYSFTLELCLMPNDRDANRNQHAKAHKDEDENENKNLGIYLSMALGQSVSAGACNQVWIKEVCGVDAGRYGMSTLLGLFPEPGGYVCSLAAGRAEVCLALVCEGVQMVDLM
ncbi:hypothetical protein TEA_028436 [Camellia sinensis var. sinensis]|uniref:Uncharacterized protein n=1 Tax=Camellia sinensis var. sinensis TaxID=542762 RepID=A0A4S4CX32_CAMSN|nr:hypothetical protein TEA_028436 [Camellia sinensis var. sinensis]